VLLLILHVSSVLSLLLFDLLFVMSVLLLFGH